jgi:hypothetical protein
MKTIIATAIALTIATSASAWNPNNAVQWSGNSGTLHADGCSYKDQTNGTMTLNKTTGKWTTTKAAEITVKSKNRNNIKVTSDNKLKTTVGNMSYVVDTATVNYNGGGIASSITTNNSGAVKNVNDNVLNLDSANKASGVTKSTFVIGGTAQMSDLDKLDDLDNNQSVWISHTVTCIQ